ncbi:MAG: 4Fe-4S binding protein [Candidatus Woesearchaeota archaeon]|jgi:Fe-S-cluster-containing hydrogenase component 2
MVEAGIYFEITTKCPQDHRCPLLNVCPIGAISQKQVGLPVIDKKVCIKCGKCVNYCPKGAVIKKKV